MAKTGQVGGESVGGMDNDVERTTSAALSEKEARIRHLEQAMEEMVRGGFVRFYSNCLQSFISVRRLVCVESSFSKVMDDNGAA